MARTHVPVCRHLVLVLGDQLDPQSPALDGFDRERDVVWMAEVAEESTRVWSHKVRTALFLSAMRHYRTELENGGRVALYRELDAPDNRGDFGEELRAAIGARKPERLIVVEPGEWRVAQILEKTARAVGVPLEVRPDRHFVCSREEFAAHAAGRKQLRME